MYLFPNELHMNNGGARLAGLVSQMGQRRVES